MKRKLVVSAFLLLGMFAFAQNYYEVPYAGTRSRLTKLTAAEEDVFVKENSVRRIYDVPDYDKLKRGEKAHSGFFTEEEGGILGTIDIFAELANVYKEEIPDEKGNYRLTVYRAMYDLKRTITFNLKEGDHTKRKCLGQIIYVPQNEKYVQYEKQVYYGDEAYMGSNTLGVQASNVQFRICGENVFAFYTKLAYMLLEYGHGEDAYNDSDGFTENAIYKTQISNIMDKTQVCEVKADFPLIDTDNPFRYSAQNAYDGDPATSYVEDTENDLFGIEFLHYNYKSNFVGDWFTKFKIINGYASTKEIYFANNRIKELIIDNENEYGQFEILDRFKCADNNLSYQLFEIRPELYYFGIKVNDIYEGTKYKDTALSEIDFYGKKNGWFFGGDVIESH